jgi:hypothetical protein
VGYEFDIFLSYKRHPEARQWLVEHFQPLLEFHVELELGRRPGVFRDDQDIEAGDTWPAHLGRALGNSRVLVALWTRTYFHSEWCSRELSTMLAREQDERLRTPERPGGVIVPVVLHDCNQLPAEVAVLQHVVMPECFNVRMRRDSQLAETLAAHISTRLAPCVAAAIAAAPDWRAEWPLTTASAYLAAVKRSDPPRQTQVPR